MIKISISLHQLKKVILFIYFKSFFRDCIFQSGKFDMAGDLLKKCLQYNKVRLELLQQYLAYVSFSHCQLGLVTLVRLLCLFRKRYIHTWKTVFYSDYHCLSFDKISPKLSPCWRIFSFLLPLFVYFLINFIFFVYDNLMEKLLCYYLWLVYIFAKWILAAELHCLCFAVIPEVAFRRLEFPC